jgi:hypothetical protein
MLSETRRTVNANLIPLVKVTGPMINLLPSSLQFACKFFSVKKKCLANVILCTCTSKCFMKNSLQV